MEDWSPTNYRHLFRDLVIVTIPLAVASKHKIETSETNEKKKTKKSLQRE